MYYILLFGVCFFFTLGLTPLMIKYLKKAQVVTMPGGRHIHTSVIPRMGGLLIYIASSFILIYFSQDLNSSRFLILASLLISLVGVLDDILGISYQIKFIFQLVVAFLVVITLSSKFNELVFFGIRIPQPLDALFLIIYITAVINAINFFDGIDGLVSKSSILWFSTILILSTMYSDHFLILLSTCMLGSILGFMKYNSYPARVFLGDTGSLSIGFFLVISSLLISGRFSESNSSEANSLDMTFSVILLMVPLIDAFRVIVQRILVKRSPFLPDKTHIHHLLLELFDSQRTVVNILENILALSCVLAIIYAAGRHLIAVIVFLLLSFLILSIKTFSTFLKDQFINSNLLISLKKHLNLIQKIFFGVTTILAVLFIAYLFSNSIKPDQNTSLIFLFLGIITFGITYVSIKKNSHTYEFFIFLNILMSLIITDLNNIISSVHSVFSMVSFLFSVNDFYVMAFLMIIILLNINILISLHFNEISRDTTTPLLLIIILMAVLFIPHFSSNDAVILLLGCLTVYIWVCRLISYYGGLAERLSYVSFSLPAGILLKFLIF